MKNISILLLALFATSSFAAETAAPKPAAAASKPAAAAKPAACDPVKDKDCKQVKK
jgi:hypothetical protein